MLVKIIKEDIEQERKSGVYFFINALAWWADMEPEEVKRLKKYCRELEREQLVDAAVEMYREKGVYKDEKNLLSFMRWMLINYATLFELEIMDEKLPALCEIMGNAAFETYNEEFGNAPVSDIVKDPNVIMDMIPYYLDHLMDEVENAEKEGYDRDVIRSMLDAEFTERQADYLKRIQASLDSLF